MEKVYIEYYSVKMLYDENTLNKFQNFNNFWEACGTYHNWCENHTFMVVMTRTVISNSTTDEYPMAVYDPEKNQRKKVYQLFADGRLSFYTAADYSARGELMQYMKTIIDEVAAKERIKTEQKVLKINADLYKLASQMETLLTQFPGAIPAKEKKVIDKEIAEMKELLDGKVD